MQKKIRISGTLTNGFSKLYATLSHGRFEEKGRDKKNKRAAFTVARMKFLFLRISLTSSGTSSLIRMFVFFSLDFAL